MPVTLDSAEFLLRVVNSIFLAPVGNGLLNLGYARFCGARSTGVRCIKQRCCEWTTHPSRINDATSMVVSRESVRLLKEGRGRPRIPSIHQGRPLQHANGMKISLLDALNRLVPVRLSILGRVSRSASCRRFWFVLVKCPLFTPWIQAQFVLYNGPPSLTCALLR